MPVDRYRVGVGTAELVVRMNFDLKTKEGLQNSVKWLSEHLSLIKEGGTWFIPRSGNAYTIIHSRKTAVHAMELLPDPSLDKVFIAAGWTVEKSISK